jgi:hypothetical protein
VRRASPYFAASASISATIMSDSAFASPSTRLSPCAPC